MALTPRECRALTSLAYAAALRGIHASLKTDMKWARKFLIRFYVRLLLLVW